MGRADEHGIAAVNALHGIFGDHNRIGRCALARHQAHPHAKTRLKDTARHFDERRGRAGLAAQRWGDGPNTAFDRASIVQFDDRPISRRKTRYVAWVDRGFDLDLARIGDTKELGLRLDKGTQTHRRGGDAPGDRACHDDTAAVAGDVSRTRRDLCAARFGRCRGGFRLRLFEIDARRHLLVVKISLARERFARQLGARSGGGPVGCDLRGIPALDYRERFTGPDGITEPLENARNRAARTGRHQRLTRRGGGDDRLRNDLRPEASCTHRLHRDAGFTDCLRSHDEAIRRPLTLVFLFFLPIGCRGLNRLCSARR